MSRYTVLWIIIFSSCHRNRRYLESLGCWACPGNRQTVHINHWRTQRIPPPKWPIQCRVGR